MTAGHEDVTHYAPPLSDEQLAAVADALGQSVDFEVRIIGGLGGTMDVIRLADGTRAVLKRYWIPEGEDVDPSQGEARSLALAAAHGIAAPVALWVDTLGLFPERALVMTFLEGRPLLQPVDEKGWAEQLATALVAIHTIVPGPEDGHLFPVLGADDGHHSDDEMLEMLQGHTLGMDLWEKRLAARQHLVSDEAVYLHHDYWPGNTLWEDERLVAVVDWEGGSIGDPELDVAYCEADIRLIGRDDAAQHFVTAYRAKSGRDLPNLDYWRLEAVCRPMPDVAMWVPGWLAMGLDITADQARSRHQAIIQQVLRSF